MVISNQLMVENIQHLQGRSGSTAPSLQASSEESGEEGVEVEKRPSQTRQPRDKDQPHRLTGKCNNREGKNQYKDRPPRDDLHVANILRGYHAKGITDNRIISKMLLEEHKITLSEGSVHRRRKLHGLHASRTTMKQLDEETKRELILEQLRKDPTGKVGPRVIKIRIFQDRGIHLTREYIRDQVRLLDPNHASRGNKHVKARRQAKLLEQQQQQAALLEQPGSSQNAFPITDTAQSATATANTSVNASLNSSHLPSYTNGHNRDVSANARPSQNLDQPPPNRVGDSALAGALIPRTHPSGSTAQPVSHPSSHLLPSNSHQTFTNTAFDANADNDDHSDNEPFYDNDVDVDMDVEMNVDSYMEEEAQEPSTPPAPISSSAANTAPATATRSTTSRAIGATKAASIRMIEDIIPRMQELSRLVGSLHTTVNEGVTGNSGAVDERGVDGQVARRLPCKEPTLSRKEMELVLSGMEAAALLERQLARMSSWKKRTRQ